MDEASRAPTNMSTVRFGGQTQVELNKLPERSLVTRLHELQRLRTRGTNWFIWIGVLGIV